MDLRCYFHIFFSIFPILIRLNSQTIANFTLNKAPRGRSVRFLMFVNKESDKSIEDNFMYQDRILRKKEVVNRTGLAGATIYRQIAKGTFPKPRKLTGEGGRAVGWLESEINAWISNRQ